MYKIIGSDGHEYGPLSAEKIKQWIAEERVEQKTPVLPDGAEDWVFLSSLPEFEKAIATQEKRGSAASVKKRRRRTAIIVLLLLAVIAGVVIFFLKHAKHHYLMYKIIGADGREYGPATAGQLRQWIAEGRANAQTQTLAPGAPEWKPLGALPEFAGHFAPPIPPVIGPPRPGISIAGQLPKTNSFATTGLIFGILSVMCCCGCPFNILGLVFSLIGLTQINRHPELYEGRGLAIAGLILSAASLVLGFGLALLNLALQPGNFEWHFKSF